MLIDVSGSIREVDYVSAGKGEGAEEEGSSEEVVDGRGSIGFHALISSFGFVEEADDETVNSSEQVDQIRSVVVEVNKAFWIVEAEEGVQVQI